MLYPFAAAFACVFATFQLGMETSRSADTWVYGITTARLPLNHSSTGRPLDALFQYLYNLTGLNIVHQQAGVALVSIAILAAAVTWLYRSFPGRNRVLRFLACFAVVSNPFLLEFFINTEVTALYCLAQLLAVAAGILLSEPVLTRGRMVTVLALTAAVFALYPPPAALILGIALIRSNPAAAVRRGLAGIACWITGAAFCWAWVRFVHPLFTARFDPRTLSPSVLTNLHSLWIGQKDLWIDSFALMPRYLFLASVLGGVALLLAAPVPKRSRLTALAAICAVIVLSLAPHLFLGSVWLVGRSVTALGSIPGLLLLAAAPFLSLRSPLYWTGFAFAGVLSLVIVAQGNRLLADNITTFHEDAAEALNITHEIERQEKAQRVTAWKLEVVADRAPTWCYPGIRCDGDMNTRSWTKQYSIPYMLRDVTGRQFTPVPFSGDIQAVFGTDNWDGYSPRQVRVIGDTAYVAVY